MTNNATSPLSRGVAFLRLFPLVTIKAAAAEARAAGFTIRREAAIGWEPAAERLLQVYPMGHGRESFPALDTSEAVFYMRARARDARANRFSMACNPSVKAQAEVIAEAAQTAAGIDQVATLPLAELVPGQDGRIAAVHFTFAINLPDGRRLERQVNCDSPYDPIALAAACEYAADELAAVAREDAAADCLCLLCNNNFDSMGGLVQICPRCNPEAYRDAIAREEAAAAIFGPDLESEVLKEGPAEDATAGTGRVECYDSAPQDGRAAAMLSGESVVPVFGPDGDRVATLSRASDGVVILTREDGTRVRTFPGTPTVAAVRKAIAEDATAPSKPQQAAARSSVTCYGPQVPLAPTTARAAAFQSWAADMTARAVAVCPAMDSPLVPMTAATTAAVMAYARGAF